MSEHFRYNMAREVVQEDLEGYRVLYIFGTQLFTTDPERVHWLKIEEENLVSFLDFSYYPIGMLKKNQIFWPVKK